MNVKPASFVILFILIIASGSMPNDVSISTSSLGKITGSESPQQEEGKESQHQNLDDVDIEAGKISFQQNCSSCHQIGENAQNAFGPVLTDIVGRNAGAYKDYQYSDSLVQAKTGGLVWDEKQLFQWLENPSKFIKGNLKNEGASTKMPVKFADVNLRKNIIAFLATQKTATQSVDHGHDASKHSGQQFGVPAGELADNTAGMKRVKLELVKPPFLPKHTQQATGAPVVVEVELTVEERKNWPVDGNGTEIMALTYNGSIPAPIMVFHQDDIVELTLKNPASNSMEHNIDMHTVTGAHGGGDLTKVRPGEQAAVRFKADRPGVFLYHCAPGGSMTPYHVTHGMTGVIMVLPRDGLKDREGKPLKYDRAYFIGENDFYVPRDKEGKFKRYRSHGEDTADWIATMRTLIPSHVVFNGRVGALTGENTLRAKVGENVLFIHMQGNRDTRPHIIGGHGDYVWETGSFSSPPLTDQETWFVRGGSVGAAMYRFKQPGNYVYLNHNLIEAVELGAAAHIVVEGEWDWDTTRQLFKKKLDE